MRCSYGSWERALRQQLVGEASAQTGASDFGHAFGKRAVSVIADKPNVLISYLLALAPALHILRP